MSAINRSTTEYEIGRARRRFIIIFLAAVVVTAGAISLLITQRAVDNMRTKIVDLIGVNNQQQEFNVDSYLKNIEQTAALFFSDDSLCEYDATDASQDDFTMIQKENAIQDRIHDLGVLDNFTDFGVVYANDKSVGWFSNTTLQAFPSGGIYNYFTGFINDERTMSGWFFDSKISSDRLYYVKKLNKNAVIVASFYSRELSTAFKLSQDMKNMNVCLINDEDIVMYSNDADKIGKNIDITLPESEADAGYRMISNGYVISMAHCTNGWRVVSYTRESEIFSDVYRLRRFSLFATIILSLLVVGLGGIAIRRIYNPVSGVLENLKQKAEYDQLTGLMNKASFAEVVSSCIDDADFRAVRVFVMIDMDNFKKVNDTLGHGEGDVVLAGTSALFMNMFGAESVVGRVGGDEFAVYTKYEGWSMEDVRKKVEFDFRLLMDNFDKKIADNYRQCSLSLSAGAYAVDAGQSVTYDDAMKKADMALYSSKRNGKKQFSW